jgi:hypothetical protein
LIEARFCERVRFTRTKLTANSPWNAALYT